MKKFLALALTACTLTAARADVPTPKQTVITVTNLAAFPKYKFSYRLEGDQETKPIRDGKTFTAYQDVRLLVQGGSESPQEWERIKYDWRGSNVAIKVEDVKQDGQAITVTHKTTGGDSRPGKKSADAVPKSLRLFAMTGLGACGLVLLARRRKATSAESV